MDQSRQFAVGLIASTMAVALVGFVLYIENPTPLQPSFVHQSGAAMPVRSRVADPERDRRVQAMLAHFVAALESQDEAAMRADFPAMTRREARLLRSIRRRLGEDAELDIGYERVIGVARDVVDLDFVIVANQAGRSDQRRLPFHATVRNRNGIWLIEELN
ncbi:MAG: hypothetical protein ACT4O1_13415 [Gemmatimonadota bacterium]